MVKGFDQVTQLESGPRAWKQPGPATGEMLEVTFQGRKAPLVHLARHKLISLSVLEWKCWAAIEGFIVSVLKWLGWMLTPLLHSSSVTCIGPF